MSDMIFLTDIFVEPKTSSVKKKMTYRKSFTHEIQNGLRIIIILRKIPLV